VAKQLPSVWHRPFLAESGLSRLMDEIFGDFSDVGFDISPSVGKTDVYERDGSVIYEIELPGVAKEEVEIKVDQARLTISGETKRSEEVKREDYFRIGRRYGRFQRTLPLPADIEDEKAISASLKDGILKVAVPLSKSIKERAKPIEVKVE
jgi:HSP20 family protein